MTASSQNKPLCIGIDGRELLPKGFTGSGRYLSNFLNAKITRESGHHFIIYGDKKTQCPPKAPCFTFKIINAHPTVWWDQVASVRQIKCDKIDLFFTPYDKMPYFAPCPVVITIHDILYQHISDHAGLKRKLFNTLYKIQRGAFARKATHILTVSEYSQKDICALYHISPNHMTVTYNAVSEQFHPNISAEHQKHIQKKYGLKTPYILNLTNFKPHKNPEILIDAFAQLPPESRQKTHLVLAGQHNSFTHPLQNRVQMLNLEQHISFPGVIEEADLPGLYAGAQIYASPSLYEGFGLPPLEAMATGVPVVSSNTTSLPEVIGEAGISLDPLDSQAWQHAFAQLLTDVELHRALSEKGLARAKTFSLEKIAQNMLNALTTTAKRAVISPTL